MTELNKSLKVITKGAFIVFIGLFFSKIFSYLFKILIARTSSTWFGLFSIALAIVNLTAISSLLGINEGVLRYISFFNGKRDLRRIKGVFLFAIKLTLPVSILSMILLFILAPKISTLIFNKPELTTIIRGLSLIIPLIVMREIFISGFKALKQIKYEIYAKNIAENASKYFISLIIIYFGFKISGLVFAYFLAILLSFSLALFYFKKVFKFLKKVKPLYTNKKILFFSIPLIFSGFAVTLMSWTDTLILGVYASASNVGIYNATLPTAQLMYIMPHALMSLFLPVLAGFHAQNKLSELRRTYQVITKWVLTTNIVPFILFFIFSKEILRIIFSEEYIAGSMVLIILASGYFINYLTASSYYVLLTYNKTKITLAIATIGLISNIVLNLILIPKFGINGAAIATSISLILIGLLRYLYCYKILDLNLFTFKVGRIFFAGIISFIILYYIEGLFVTRGILTLGFLSLSLTLIFISSLFITKSLEKEDMMILRSIYKKITGYL
tara:strand:+ start:4639 stop:6141 length:1503 start_codon:yes stop_codon:yes gene_type:complete